MAILTINTEFDADSFYYDNDPNDLQEWFDNPCEDSDEMDLFDEIEKGQQKYRLKVKAKKSKKVGRKTIHTGPYRIIHNETRTTYQPVTNLNDFSKTFYSEYGYKNYKIFLRSLHWNLKNNDTTNKHKRKWTIQAISD